MILKLNELITKYNMVIDGVIHVGAHYGEELEDYIHAHIPQIILFEPLNDNCNVIKQKIASIQTEASVILHKTALGNENGPKEMYLSSNALESSSILAPKLHLSMFTDITFDNKGVVDVNKLDDFSECLSCNLLNMDVQGYELEVLKGGTKTLDNIDYIYCEVNRAEVYANNAMVTEIDEFLQRWNFHRVETAWWAGTSVWGDAFYIKQ